jgi:hypothetical protein
VRQTFIPIIQYCANGKTPEIPIYRESWKASGTSVAQELGLGRETAKAFGNYYRSHVSQTLTAVLHFPFVRKPLSGWRGPLPGKGPSMTRFIFFPLSTIMFLCLLVGTERRAWGYVDPGSGLIALQTFASVAAAYIYLIRNRIRAFFSRRKQARAGVLPVSAKNAGSSEAA